MKIRKAALALAAVMIGALSLAGCTDVPPAEEASPAPPAVDSTVSDSILEPYGLDGKDAVSIIDTLDGMKVSERPKDLKVSVKPDHIEVSNADGKQASISIPEDRFYLSVAPYVSENHDCYYHSLTTCLGELGNKDVKIRVVSDDGTVLVDETRTLYDNGFTGLWLPKGISGKIEASYDGKTGSHDFSTKKNDDLTCLNELKLS